MSSFDWKKHFSVFKPKLFPIRGYSSPSFKNKTQIMQSRKLLTLLLKQFNNIWLSYYTHYKNYCLEFYIYKMYISYKVILNKTVVSLLKTWRRRYLVEKLLRGLPIKFLLPWNDAMMETSVFWSRFVLLWLSGKLVGFVYGDIFGSFHQAISCTNWYINFPEIKHWY